MKTIETLKSELINLRDKLFNQEGEPRKEILKQYREKETEIKELKQLTELNKYNKQHAEKRDIAKIIFELEKVDLNDITNDSQINKTRLKKYPKCKELDYLFFCSQDFKANYYEINFSGKWTVFFYENGEYKKIVDFNHFLKLNYIEPKEITFKQFKQIENKTKKQLLKMKEAEKKLFELREEINPFYYNGLLNQQSNTYYTFTTKF